MNEGLLTHALGSVISAATATAIVVYLSKKFFEKYLDRTFARSQMVEQSVLDIAASNSQTLFNSQLPVYAEIHEVTYRARNAARVCDQSDAPPLDAVSDFAQSRFHLVENIYKYRIFVEADLFRDLHYYKNLVQEFGILLDEVTRAYGVDDSTIDDDIRRIAETRLHPKFLDLNEHFELLDGRIRQFVSSRTSELGEK